jgi:hypothetical protein
MKLRLDIHDMKQLQRFFDEAQQIPNVIDIKKTSQLKYQFTWSVFIINTLLWVAQYATHFFTQFSIPSSIVIFAMVFSVGATYYLNLLSNHMVSHLSSRPRMLNLFLITNICIVLIIVMEKWQENINISWLTVLSFGIVLLGLTVTEWYQYNFCYENTSTQ